MTDDFLLSLPVVRPKVGRRASDRKILDEWYARFPDHDDPGAEPDRADDWPARLLWREPDSRSASGPDGDRRAERRMLSR